MMEMVEKGVSQGVEQGVKKITAELTSGELATQLGMPEGAPTHLGTMPQPGQSPQGQEGEVGSQGQGNGNPAHDAAVGQGSKQGPTTQQGMGPQTHLVGSQPGPGQKNLTPGV